MGTFMLLFIALHSIITTPEVAEIRVNMYSKYSHTYIDDEHNFKESEGIAYLNSISLAIYPESQPSGLSYYGLSIQNFEEPEKLSESKGVSLFLGANLMALCRGFKNNYWKNPNCMPENWQLFFQFGLGFPQKDNPYSHTKLLLTRKLGNQKIGISAEIYNMHTDKLYDMSDGYSYSVVYSYNLGI